MQIDENYNLKHRIEKLKIYSTFTYKKILTKKLHSKLPKTIKQKLRYYNLNLIK